MTWFRQDGSDLILQVQVQPRARREAVAGVKDGRLKIQLTSPPVDGRANEHLIAYLAKLFGVPKSSVILEQGGTSRRKVLRIRSPKKRPENLDCGR